VLNRDLEQSPVASCAGLCTPVQLADDNKLLRRLAFELSRAAAM
jgi:hypothetical protein